MHLPLFKNEVKVVAKTQREKASFTRLANAVMSLCIF